MSLLLVSLFIGRGRIRANGGAATCTPHCYSCDGERRCHTCTDGKYWKDYNCVEECSDPANRRPRNHRGHHNRQLTGMYCHGETGSQKVRMLTQFVY